MELLILHRLNYDTRKTPVSIFHFTEGGWTEGESVSKNLGSVVRRFFVSDVHPRDRLSGSIPGS